MNDIVKDIITTIATKVCHMKSSIMKVPGLGVMLADKRKNSLSLERIKESLMSFQC